MEENIINDALLDEFKAGEVSKKGVHLRTNFRVRTQHVINAINAMLSNEKWQLSNGEIAELKNMIKRLKMMIEE